MGRGTRRGSACCESLPKSGKSAEKVEKSEAAGWKSLPKSGKSAERGRDSQCCRPEISTQRAEISRKGQRNPVPSPGNLYPNRGNQPKKVEKSEAAVWKSLPKERETAEKGRESQVCFWEISTQIGEISRKGQRFPQPPVGNLYPNGKNQRKRQRNPQFPPRNLYPKGENHPKRQKNPKLVML